MSHGSPPLPKTFPPPGGLSVSAAGAMGRVGASPPQPPGLTRDQETRALALQAAATLLGPLVAALVGAGRPGPVSMTEGHRAVDFAEARWLKLAASAETWVRDGDPR